MKLIICLLLSMRQDEITISEYNTTKEDRKQYLWIKEYSIKSIEVCYDYSTHIVIWHDRNSQKFYHSDFTSAHNSFLDYSINLRKDYSELWDGIQYSGINYIDNQDLIINFKNSFEIGIKRLEDSLGFDPELIFTSKAHRLKLEDYLDEMTVEKRFELEVPILLLFAKEVGRLGYEISVIDYNNSMREIYKGLGFKSNYGYNNDLTEMIWQCLYPDMERDELEVEPHVNFDWVMQHLIPPTKSK